MVVEVVLELELVLALVEELEVLLVLALVVKKVL
jgi:hypothetical protein